jgi:hypothetical protein
MAVVQMAVAMHQEQSFRKLVIWRVVLTPAATPSAISFTASNFRAKGRSWANNMSPRVAL